MSFDFQLVVPTQFLAKFWLKLEHLKEEEQHGEVD